MLIIFTNSEKLLLKHPFTVTASFFGIMSSNTRSLRSRTIIKAEPDISNDNTLKKTPKTSKYFQIKNVKQESDAPPIKNKEIEKLTKKTKDKETNKNLLNNKQIKQETVVSVKTKKTDVQQMVIKSEPDLSENIKKEVLSDDDFVPSSNAVECKIEVSKAEEGPSSLKRKLIKPESGTTKTGKVVKVKAEVADMEDIGWEPDNWIEVLDNILKMRKLHVAPVDSLGCEECPEDGVSPEVFRYQTLISVMLSSQTRDEVTFAASQRLIAHGLTVDSILNTSEEKIGQLIYPAGFWKSKVKYIRNTTQILKDQYNGDIPRTFKELCKLPGVGPKMANIVMSVGWKETVGIAVDTHVHRISNRLGWVPKPTKDPEHTRKALEAWLPKGHWWSINITLVGFGQTICKPVGPSCENCLNSHLCPFGKSVLSGKNKKTKKK